MDTLHQMISDGTVDPLAFGDLGAAERLEAFRVYAEANPGVPTRLDWLIDALADFRAEAAAPEVDEAVGWVLTSGVLPTKPSISVGLASHLVASVLETVPTRTLVAT